MRVVRDCITTCRQRRRKAVHRTRNSQSVSRHIYAGQYHEVRPVQPSEHYALNILSALNGLPIPDAAYGNAPIGILIYTASGWMSATITATEPEFRPNLTFPFQPNDTDADWAAVGRHSIGYAGPLVRNVYVRNICETNTDYLYAPLAIE
jgi:hypothetical protein